MFIFFVFHIFHVSTFCPFVCPALCPAGLEAITGFVGLSRIFLGRLECGMTLFVCSETQDPRGGVPSLSSAGSSGGNSSSVSAQRKLNQQQYVVEGIYLLFGQDLRPVKEATAGSVVALSLVPAGAPKEAASGAPQGAFKDVVRDVTSWIQGLRASGGCLMQTENPCRYTDELDIHRRGPLAMEGALRCSTLSNDPSCPSLVSPYSKVCDARCCCCRCTSPAAAAAASASLLLPPVLVWCCCCSHYQYERGSCCCA